MELQDANNFERGSMYVPFAQNSNKQKQQILLLLKSDASVYVSRKLAWLHDILKSCQLPNQNFHATILDVTICPGKGSLWLGGQEVLSLWTMQWNGYVYFLIIRHFKLFLISANRWPHCGWLSKLHTLKQKQNNSLAQLALLRRSGFKAFWGRFKAFKVDLKVKFYIKLKSI